MSSSHRIGFEIHENLRPRDAKMRRYERGPGTERHLESVSYQRMRERAEDEPRMVDYLAVAAPAPAVPRFERSVRRLAEMAVAPLAFVRARAHLQLASQLTNLAQLPIEDPWIGLGEDGSVGVDWMQEGRRLAITFEVGGEVEFYAKDAVSDKGHGDATSPAIQLGLLVWLVLGPGLRSRK
jgi:hypothetical protein